MATDTTINPYLRTKVLTASPEELRLLLLDGAIRFASQAREGLDEKDHHKSYEGFRQARDIIMELINSMRPEANPELCARLSGLYTFMYTELVSASLEKDAARVGKVIGLLEYERETWQMLMQKLAEERTGGTPRATPAAFNTPAGGASPAAATQRSPLSISA